MYSLACLYVSMGSGTGKSNYVFVLLIPLLLLLLLTNVIIVNTKEHCASHIVHIADVWSKTPNRVTESDMSHRRLLHSPTGCCFITYYTRKSALEAQNALHNMKILPGVS